MGVADHPQDTLALALALALTPTLTVTLALTLALTLTLTLTLTLALTLTLTLTLTLALTLTLPLPHNPNQDHRGVVAPPRRPRLPLGPARGLAAGRAAREHGAATQRLRGRTAPRASRPQRQLFSQPQP